MSEEKKSNPPPVLRKKDDVALWPTKDGDKAFLSGYVTLDGEKVYVRAFLNDTDKEGNQLAHPYLSLTTNTAAKGEPPVWKTVAYGNAMNSRKDDKEVYFDQMIFNVAGSGDTFGAFVGKGCTEELHRQLGFTSPQIARPVRSAEDDQPDNDHQEDGHHDAAPPGP